MLAIQESHQDDYLISTDPGKLDAEAVYAFLTTAYWCQGIPLALVRKALANSLCFGLYHQGKQVGLSRVVTDYSTYATSATCTCWRPTAARAWGTGWWNAS